MVTLVDTPSEGTSLVLLRSTGEEDRPEQDPDAQQMILAKEPFAWETLAPRKSPYKSLLAGECHAGWPVGVLPDG
jgi:hypothetical protein